MALIAYKQLLTTPAPDLMIVFEACAMLSAFGAGFIASPGSSSSWTKSSCNRLWPARAGTPTGVVRPVASLPGLGLHPFLALRHR